MSKGQEMGGSAEADRAGLWRLSQADMKRGVYLEHGVAYVLPSMESKPRWVRRVGCIAVGFSVRWSSWSIGVDILRAGLLLKIGPSYFWIAHIERQLGAFEAAQASAAPSDVTESDAP